MDKKTVEYFKIIIAGRKIEIECNYRIVFNQCRNYLANFTNPDSVIKTPAEEIAAERFDAPEMHVHDPDISVRYADEFTELRVVYKKIAEKLLQFDTFLMHGSVVSTKNVSYMFTATSGVGKSTRTKIWLDEYPGSFVVNGDKPLIKITDTEVLACGTPWCGSEGWNTNTMVPLRAIFLLERAGEDEPDSIEEVSLGKAFPFLLQQTYRPADPDLMRKTIDLLKAMEGKVRFYKFRSHPTAESVRLAYETARPK